MGDEVSTRHLLPGPSLWACGRIIFVYIGWCGLGGVMLLAFIAVGNLSGSNSLQRAFEVSLWVWLIGVVLGAIGVALVSARAKQEIAAGYTTSPYGDQEMDLIDARSGVVLRRAGERMLDRAEFRSAIRAARRGIDRSRRS